MDDDLAYDDILAEAGRILSGEDRAMEGGIPAGGLVDMPPDLREPAMVWIMAHRAGLEMFVEQWHTLLLPAIIERWLLEQRERLGG